MSLVRPTKRRKTNPLPKLDFGDSPVIQFFSKSRKSTLREMNADPKLAELEEALYEFPQWRRYLSNFARVPLPGISYNGKLYPSVEHAFAAAKYASSTGTGDPPDFSVGSELGGSDNIKKKHSRKGMEKYGFVLDVKAFDKLKYDITRKLVRARSEIDERFRDILTIVYSHGFKLLHFARGGGAGWGGYKRKEDGVYVGFNLLGQIMNELASDLATSTSLLSLSNSSASPPSTTSAMRF